MEVVSKVRLSPIALLRRLGFRRFVTLIRHLPSFAKLFSRLVKDPRVGLTPKLVLVGSFLYLILPTDLVPDFLPGIGQIDDLAIIYLGAKLFLRLCPKEIVQEHVHAIGKTVLT
jgi:uncharacterized membrane protein YkvA (DUF1232 family)